MATPVSHDVGNLLDMARRNEPGERAKLYEAITALFERKGGELSQTERALMREILRHLAHQVEMQVRLSLAERLAGDPEAPADLILLLANDRIEVARPVLTMSEVLDERDLVDIVTERSDQHRRAVAQRPEVTPPVSAAIVASGTRETVLTLLENKGARVDRPTMAILVGRSRADEGLQEPLLAQPSMTEDLAVRMVEWVSEELKSYIAERFEIDASRLESHLSSARGGAEPAGPPPSPTAARLVAQMKQAGRLRPSFLLKALHQNQLDLFDHAFAALLDVAPDAFKSAVYQPSLLPMALACRALDLKVDVFQTVVNMTWPVRGLTIADSEEPARARAIFQDFSAADATAAFFDQCGLTREAATGTHG